MTPTLRTLLVAIASVPALVLAGTTWIAFASSPDGDTAYLDTSTVKLSGSKRSAWTKVEKVKPEPYGAGMVQRYVVRVEVDCRNRTSRTLAEVGYQPDGSVLYQVPESRNSSLIPPETMGELRLEAICTFKPAGRR